MFLCFVLVTDAENLFSTTFSRSYRFIFKIALKRRLFIYFLFSKSTKEDNFFDLRLPSSSVLVARLVQKRSRREGLSFVETISHTLRFEQNYAKRAAETAVVVQ